MYLSGVCRETGTNPLSGVWEQERSAYVCVGGCVPSGGRRNSGLGRKHMFFFNSLMSLISQEGWGVARTSGLSLKGCSHFFFNSSLIFFFLCDV